MRTTGRQSDSPAATTLAVADPASSLAAMKLPGILAKGPNTVEMRRTTEVGKGSLGLRTGSSGATHQGQPAGHEESWPGAGQQSARARGSERGRAAVIWAVNPKGRPGEDCPAADRHPGPGARPPTPLEVLPLRVGRPPRSGRAGMLPFPAKGRAISGRREPISGITHTAFCRCSQSPIWPGFGWAQPVMALCRGGDGRGNLPFPPPPNGNRPVSSPATARESPR